MRHSIRWTLLPRSALLGLLFTFGLLETCLWEFARLSGVSANDPVLLQIRPICGVFLVLFMCWYGLYRVMKFHPVVQAKYRQWLELSPWTNRLPLPLGPVMFVWQDAVLIGAVTALASMRYGIAPLAPLTA